MRKRIARFLARRYIPDELAISRPLEHSAPRVPLALDPGLDDAVLSGWFSSDSGELFTGFPINADDVVLDVGCGDGGCISFCASRGAKVIFADINAEKVAEVERLLQGSPSREIVPIISNANPLPIASGTASKVVSTEVIEHVEDPARFLAELVRVGQPGAQYLLSVPAPDAEHIQKHFAPSTHFEHPNHIRIIEHDEFVQMVERAGLIIERRASYGAYWSIWWFLFWACKGQGFSPPWHPLLQSWMNTWAHLLQTELGPTIKKALDDYLPKSQIIIARKPN